MKININTITNGSMNGHTVYICDYRKPDIHKKAIRSVPPTRVLIRDNSESTKRVYYSESHFVPLNAKNQPTKKVIPLFDNTGFRSNTGTPLNVFDNEQECNDCWNAQIDEYLERLNCYKKSIHDEINAEIQELESKKS